MAVDLSDITERRPCAYPVVYGYLRLTSKNTARRGALGAAIATYCHDHELSLGGVFTDYSRADLPAIGFTGLLDVLGLIATYGVVTPTESHLGRGADATNRKRQVARSGARLLILRERSELRLSAEDDPQKNEDEHVKEVKKRTENQTRDGR